MASITRTTGLRRDSKREHTFKGVFDIYGKKDSIYPSMPVMRWKLFNDLTTTHTIQGKKAKKRKVERNLK